VAGAALCSVLDLTGATVAVIMPVALRATMVEALGGEAAVRSVVLSTLDGVFPELHNGVGAREIMVGTMGEHRVMAVLGGSDVRDSDLLSDATFALRVCKVVLVFFFPCFDLCVDRH
jgi:hypothetical protein